MEMATATSAPVLLFKMRRMFFFTVKTGLCAVSERSTRSFFPEAPYTLHALPSQLSLISFLNGTTGSAISSRTLWTIFLAGKDQQQINQPNDQAGG